MIRILKLTTFIAHLPLSAFPLFREKRHNLNKLSYSHTSLYIICIIVATSLFIKLPQAEGSFTEQIAIDPVAISLANTVSARPPGIAAIHYNPAGLSLLGDGNFISQGVILPIIKKTSKFEDDPTDKGFHDLHGNVIKDPLAGTEGTNTSGKLYIPVLDFPINFLVGPITALSARKPGSNWTYAFSMYAPFAGGWNLGDDNDPGRYEGKSIYLQHLIYFGPAVSYRVNKTLSLGAAFGAGQTAMGLSTDARAPNEIVNITRILGDATQGGANPINDLTIPFPLFAGGIGPYDTVGNLSLAIRDDFTPSYNLGALWEPYDWISFGISYNSAIKAHMTGKFSFKYSDQWQRMVAWEGSTPIMIITSMIFDLPYQSTAEQTGNVSLDMELPQLVNFGIKLKPVKRLSLLVDLHWANWSTTKEFDIKFDQKIQLLQMAKFMGYAKGSYDMVLARNMKDTLNWSAGIEYQLLDWLQLRAGYENRQTSTPDDTYDLMSLPTLDYYGAGLGIKLKDDVDIDFCLGYLINKSYKVSNNGSVNLNSTVLGAGVNNPYRGLNVETQMAMYIAGIKITMPLEAFMDMQTELIEKQLHLIQKLLPAKWRHHPATVSSKAAEKGKPVNLRPEEKNYYTADGE